MANSLTLPPLFSPQVLSEYVEIPTTTLAQWRWAGTGPAYVKVGRMVRYRRDDVESWLDSQRHETAEAI